MVKKGPTPQAVKRVAGRGASPVARPPAQKSPGKRTYISQEDVPYHSLNEALRVGRAIVEEYGGKPCSPLDVAAGLSMAPSSGHFRMTCGASIAYGITEGGCNAKEISLTDLGRRILMTIEEGDDLQAKREAVLRPRVFREFLQKYDQASLPRPEIAVNVLGTLGVPKNRANSVLELILESADEVGFLRQVKDKRYVDLARSGSRVSGGAVKSLDQEERREEPDSRVPDPPEPADPKSNGGIGSPILTTSRPGLASPDPANRKVFITHGKNTAFIDPIKRLLAFGELAPVVSVEKQSVSQPVPDKVMNDMRSCSAAIIHVDGEQVLMDKDANEHTVVNPNVLIEIGAAMALYGRRFILLVKDGVKLPSNLQGLYEVRYAGDVLDGAATIKLLEAINDIKNNPLPGQQQER